MAAAMAGPDICLAKAPISVSTLIFSWSPNVAMMVPISKLANRPCAMALMASMP